MAENQIDSLIVSIDLDSSNFSLACKKVGEDLKHAAEEAKHRAEEIKEHGEKMAGFWEKMKEHAIEFFGIMASVGAFVAFTEHTIKSQTAMMHLSEETKASVEEISLWQNAAVIAGGSAEGFNQSLKGMGEQLVSIEKGLPRAQRALKAFEAAGITGLGKGKHVETMSMYEKIHEKFQKLSMIEAQTLGKRMQLDEATIRVLHKSGEEYEEFMAKAKAAGVVTEQHAKEAEKAEEAMNEFKITMQRVAEVIVNMIIPSITKMAEKFTAFMHWIQDHSKVVIGAVMALAAAIFFLNIQTIAAIPAVIAHWVAETAGAYAASFAFLTAGTSASAMWTAILGPVGLTIIAIIAIVALLVGAYNKFKWFHDTVNAIFAFMKTYIMGILSGLWDMVKNVFGFIKGSVVVLAGVFTFNWDKIKDGAKDMLHGIVEFFRMYLALMLLPVLATAVAIKNVFTKIFGDITQPAKAFFAWIEDKFKGLGKIVSAVANLFTDQSDSGQQNPRGPDRMAEAMHDQMPSAFQPAFAGGFHDSAPSGFSRQAPTSTPLPKVHPSVIQAHAIAAVRPTSVAAAAASNIKTSTVHNDTHIGEVTIITETTDPQGVRDALADSAAFNRRMNLMQSDQGVM